MKAQKLREKFKEKSNFETCLHLKVHCIIALFLTRLLYCICNNNIHNNNNEEKKVVYCLPWQSVKLFGRVTVLKHAVRVLCFCTMSYSTARYRPKHNNRTNRTFHTKSTRHSLVETYNLT